MGSRLALVFVVLMSVGCATLFAKGTKEVSLKSAPSGARVKVDGNPMGVTPVSVKLDNNKAHTVVFSMEGKEDMTCLVTASVGAGWVVLDILGGLFPIVIDAVTGDWRTLDEEECEVTLAEG